MTATQAISEDQLQSKCYQWFHNSFPDLRGLLYAVPNGGYRNGREANRLKATGVVAGVHDLQFQYQGTHYTFELKVGGNSLSSAQVRWWKQMEAHGARCFEIRDFDTFCEIIKTIVNG